MPPFAVNLDFFNSPTASDFWALGDSFIKVTIDIPDWVVWVFVQPVLLFRRVRYGYTFRRIALSRGKYAIVDVKA